MRTTINAAGRLVIPKEIRRQAGIEAGMVLDIRCEDGRIEIEPAVLPVRLIREGTFLVAVLDGDVEPLTVEEVEQTLEALRRERSRQG